MKPMFGKLEAALFVTLNLMVASPAVGQTINNLGAGSAVSGTDMFPAYQGANPAKRVTAAQINTYVQSLWGAGCATFLATPSSANFRGCLTDEVGTGAFYTVGGALGTPASGTATNLTGLPISTGLTGAGTGVLTALGVNVGSAGAFVTFNGALGTPSSGTATNLTGLPISTGLTGAGTGVLTALGVNVGSAGAPVLFNGAGGTPSSLTLTNATGLPLAQLTGAGTGVLSALAAAMNSSAGPIGALTATNGNCVVGNGTAWTSTTCPGGTAANPTATAGPTAVNGVASTYMRSDGAPAVQGGTSAQKGIVQVDGTTITETGNVISAAPITAIPDIRTGTNSPIVAGDRGKIIYLDNASPQTPTLPTAASVGNGWFVSVCNINAGLQTLTPTTSTIGGNANLPISPGTSAKPTCYSTESDGSNYRLFPSGNIFQIASGTAALGTGAISSATCASAVTVSAPGVATTDVVLASFNGDPTAVTGYVPLTSGMLTIIGYPTANNVNFKVCNNTSGSITPGAITLNWRVNR